RRHTRSKRDWSSDVCSSDLIFPPHRSIIPCTCLFQMIDKCSITNFCIFFVFPVDIHPFHWYYIRANSDGPLAQLAEQLTLNQWEIGRASCRAGGQSCGWAGR